MKTEFFDRVSDCSFLEQAHQSKKEKELGTICASDFC
jgi:hypothetical protein